jgi:hypothetical protein
MNATTTVSWVHAVAQRSTISSNNRISSNSADGAELPSIKEAKADMYKDPHGALSKLNDSRSELASLVLRPKNNLRPEGPVETSAYSSRHSITTAQSGAALGIMNIISRYTTSARESIGPPVSYVDAIKSFHGKLTVRSSVESKAEKRSLNAVA